MKLIAYALLTLIDLCNIFLQPCTFFSLCSRLYLGLPLFHLPFKKFNIKKLKHV